MHSSLDLLLIFLVAATGVSMFVAGGFRSRLSEAGFDWGKAALYLALAPHVIALWSYLIFATLAWIAPIRLLYLAGPPLIAIGLLFLSRAPPAKAASPRRRVATEWIMPLLLLAVTTLLLGSIASYATDVTIAHDFSLYLNESTALSSAMSKGLSGPLDWLRVRQEGAVHPHGRSFSLYLAWGFLGSTTPGFGNDAVPRFLVWFGQFCLVAAVFALPTFFLGSHGWGVGLLAVALMQFDPTWHNLLVASSREYFYVAPFLVYVALLARATPPEGARRSRIELSAFALALLGALMGHSLGIIYVTGATLAFGLVRLYRHRARALTITELWLATAGCALAGLFYAGRYLGSAARDIGFSYPFLSLDPALLKNWKETTAFGKQAGAADLLAFLLGGNPAGYVTVVILAAGLFGVALFGLRSRFVMRAGAPALALMLIVLCILGLVFLTPIKLDGIGLPAAFVSNQRYAFGIRLVAYAAASLGLAALCRALIYRFWRGAKARRSSDLVRILSANVTAATVAIAGIAWASVTHTRGNSEIRSILARYAHIEATACWQIVENGARLTYIDYDGTLYRCNRASRSLYSQGGAEIISSRTDDEFREVLARQEVDAFVFHTPYLANNWAETFLYKYLDRNWKKDASFERLLIFSRPRTPAH